MTLVRVAGIGFGAMLLFFALLEGFHSAVEEVGGKALADHALVFCPNWLLGLVTGAFFVGLLWWFSSTHRK